MTRRSFFFDCEGGQCAATLDLPPDGVEAPATGLIIVTGGNELRSGPHGTQSAMAAHFAAKGFPVLRYDRRGVGDSGGENTGWRGAETDLVSAADTFRKTCPNLPRIIGFGNCDGASSLALFANAANLSHVIVANPWVFDHDGESAVKDEAPAAAPEHSRASTLRYYRRRLANPIGLMRDLIGGKVNLGQAMGDVASIGKSAMATRTAVMVSGALNDRGHNATLLLAQDDRTALYFQEQMSAIGHTIAAHIYPTASHSFADDAARAWLFAQIEAVLLAS